MKMNYHLKSKPKYPNRKNFLIIGGLFVLVSTFGFLFSGFTQNTLRTISYPVWIIKDTIKIPFVKVGQFFSFKTTLINRNIELEQELMSLRLKTFDYDVVVQENESLKNNLGRAPETSNIFSKVLSKPPVSPYDTLVLDVGSIDGVVLGSKVYTSNNIIIGLIKNVTSKTSLVELFSSSNQEQELMLARTGAFFAINGRGGGNLQLEVPKDTDVMWGDTFVYPGLKTSVVGSVYYIDSSSQSSFKTVYIRLLANIFEVKSVFIEKSI